MEQANELIENLSEAEIKRGNTSRTLTDLALSIVGRKKNIDVTTLLLKMEAMAVLGSPRGGGTGEAASKAGEAGRAELRAMEIGISMDEIKKAQKVLEEDEKATMRLNEIYAKLERIAEDIRPSFPHLESAKTILCFFLVASANRRHSATSRQRYLAGLLATILARTTATKKSGKIVKRISDEVSSCLISTLADVFPKGALETPKDTVESILGPFYFPAVLKHEGEEPGPFNRPFDIYTFLMALERESSGYRAFGTGTLSELEMRFDLQRAAMKQLQLEIPKYD